MFCFGLFESDGCTPSLQERPKNAINLDNPKDCQAHLRKQVFFDMSSVGGLFVTLEFLNALTSFLSFVCSFSKDAIPLAARGK